MPRKFRFHDARKGAAITVVVIPDADENLVSRVLKNGSIEIHLKTTKRDVDYNHSLKSFLSQVLNVPPGGIEVVGGVKRMEKIVAIDDLDAATLNVRIKNLILSETAGE